MFNRMFFFAKTANKFETVSVVALILGLAAFIAPVMIEFIATALAIVIIWAKIPERFVLKLVLSVGAVLTTVFLLSGVIYFFAITLAGVGLVGVSSLLIRYISAEVKFNNEQREAEEDEDFVDEEEQNMVL